MFHKHTNKASSFTSYLHALRLLICIKIVFMFLAISDTHTRKKQPWQKSCLVHWKRRKTFFIINLAGMTYSSDYLMNNIAWKAPSNALTFFLILTHKPWYLILSLNLIVASQIVCSKYTMDCWNWISFDQVIHDTFISLLTQTSIQIQLWWLQK